jgi:hypothetical protein
MNLTELSNCCVPNVDVTRLINLNDRVKYRSTLNLELENRDLSSSLLNVQKLPIKPETDKGGTEIR